LAWQVSPEPWHAVHDAGVLGSTQSAEPPLLEPELLDPEEPELDPDEDPDELELDDPELEPEPELDELDPEPELDPELLEPDEPELELDELVLDDPELVEPELDELDPLDPEEDEDDELASPAWVPASPVVPDVPRSYGSSPGPPTAQAVGQARRTLRVITRGPRFIAEPGCTARGTAQ
jgi:hypothetical protein